jgi:hypothetical protein
MPTETRYFNGDLTFLTTVQGASTSVTRTSHIGTDPQRWGVRIYALVSGAWQEMTSGVSAIVQISADTSPSWFSNTASLSAKNNVTQLKAEVYHRYDNEASWTLMRTFTSETFTARNYDGSTITVYYRLSALYDPETGSLASTFYYQSLSPYSRVVNFSYSIPAVAVKKPIMDGLVLVE